jgi:hypothetical protein
VIGGGWIGLHNGRSANLVLLQQAADDPYGRWSICEVRIMALADPRKIIGQFGITTTTVIPFGFKDAYFYDQIRYTTGLHVFTYQFAYDAEAFFAAMLLDAWPPSRYHMDGHTDHEGWDIARKRLPMVAAGDIVIPYLMHHRFGLPGKVTSVAVSDADWKPTVEKGRYQGNRREAELGRRIYVEWMSNGTPPPDKIAIVPRKMRHANGEVHQSIEPLNPERFGRFMDILKDRKNWRDYEGNRERSTKRTDNTPTADKIHLRQGTLSYVVKCKVRSSEFGSPTLKAETRVSHFAGNRP